MKENFKIIGLMENGLGQHNRLKVKNRGVFLALPQTLWGHEFVIPIVALRLS